MSNMKHKLSKRPPKVPHVPTPYRVGTKIIRKFEVAFEDRIGNKAIMTKVDYTDKKGKLIENYLLHVKWY